MIGQNRPTIQAIEDSGSLIDMNPRLSTAIKIGANAQDFPAGLATGGSATTLIDTGVDFTALTFPDVNPVIDDRVINVTDDSEGIITSIAATTITMAGTSQLDGGADDTFAASDAYRIESSESPRHQLRVHPAPSATDTTGTESIRVYHAREHRAITQAQMDAGRDGLEIDVELEDALVRKIAQLAQEREFGVDSSEAIAQATHFNNEYFRAIPQIRRRIRQFKSTWIQILNRRNIRGQSDNTLRSSGNPFNNVIIS